MSKGFFITGTDTGVGKTIISWAVIRALKYLGLKTGAMKPLETGCSREGDILVPYDGMFLKEISHMDEPITLISPCCFESPLSPLAASKKDMTALPDISKIKKAQKKLSSKYETLVVEGAGGLMVPIKKNYYMLNLAMEFGFPLIVVARPGLGTINHTMLTVNCALKEGLEVAGIIINYSLPPQNSLAEKTNPGLFSQISPVPVMGIFPYLRNLDEEAVEKMALKNLDLDQIKKYL